MRLGVLRRLCCTVAPLVAAWSAHGANIQANAYAWGENIGWINFAPASGPGVTVGDSGISGLAWSENLGWLNFAPTSGGVVNNGAGMLSGYAWSENGGWINFRPTGGGVSISTVTGAFGGFAWGENVGWINFTVATPVITTWRPNVGPAGTGVASRKVHGAAGVFDLPLALTPANPTTEPRQGPTHTIVFTFDKTLVSGDAAISEGTATAGAPTFSGNEMMVPLTGVGNAQYVTVVVSNVTAADGSAGGTGSIRVGFLRGDVNQTRVVSVADLGLVNAVLTQSVTAANFLRDVNASGALTVADKGITNAVLTTALPLP